MTSQWIGSFQPHIREINQRHPESPGSLYPPTHFGKHAAPISHLVMKCRRMTWKPFLTIPVSVHGCKSVGVETWSQSEKAFKHKLLGSNETEYIKQS